MQSENHFAARATGASRRPWFIEAGFSAGLTVFDAATVIDHATYTKPDQLSKGVLTTSSSTVYWKMIRENSPAPRTNALFDAKVSPIRPLTAGVLLPAYQVSAT
jgi:hypothetical protein